MKLSDMEKKEFAVGEEFQMGLKRLRVEIDTTKNPCMGCMFCSIDKSCIDMEDFIGPCLKDDRSDKTDVIFVEVE